MKNRFAVVQNCPNYGTDDVEDFDNTQEAVAFAEKLQRETDELNKGMNLDRITYYVEEYTPEE